MYLCTCVTEKFAETLLLNRFLSFTRLLSFHRSVIGEARQSYLLGRSWVRSPFLVNVLFVGRIVVRDERQRFENWRF